MKTAYILGGIAVGAMCFFSALPCHASREAGFFETSSGAKSTEPAKGGYFFYKDAKKELPPKEKKNSAPEISQPKTDKAPESQYSPTNIPWHLLEHMPPKEFQSLLLEVLDYALEHPEDKQRMLNYITIQAVAMKRAEDFQIAWGQILTEYPALDPTASRPVSKVATQTIVMEKVNDSRKYIADMRDKMGILVFKRHDCKYCAEQHQIFERFIQEYEWKNYQEIDIREHPELAAEYGVEIVPDIYLVANFDGEIHRQRLNTGLTTADVIMDTLLRAYSSWYLGEEVYKPDSIRQGDQALERHIQTMKDNNPNEPKSKQANVKNILDKLKHQE